MTGTFSSPLRKHSCIYTALAFFFLFFKRVHFFTKSLISPLISLSHCQILTFPSCDILQRICVHEINLIIFNTRYTNIKYYLY